MKTFPLYLVWILVAVSLSGQSRHRTDAAGGVLKQYTIASFGGSGQNSIQSVARDSNGNIYLAGTTSSPDLPVKSAAQTEFGEARILGTTIWGATWTRVGSPADINTVTADAVLPQVLFAGGDTGIYKSTNGGQTWRDRSTIFSLRIPSAERWLSIRAIICAWPR